MTFYRFLKEHPRNGEESPIGDFIEDVMGDRHFPARISTKRLLESYLSYTRRACLEAMAAFEELWKDYQEYKKGDN